MKLRSVRTPYWRGTISTRARSIEVKIIGIWIAIVIVHIVSTAYAKEPGPSLWIADDTTRTVYEVTVDDGPELNSSTILKAEDRARPLRNAYSGIALDPTDDTLWGASETTFQSASGEELDHGSVVNFGRDGSFLWEVRADSFGACSVEGVAVDYFDGSLWVVDDPVGVGACLAPGIPAHHFPTDHHVPTIHHIAKDGTPIDSFPTPPGATSPQAIALDPFDGTLWMTDNRELKVYHIERDGYLIGGSQRLGSATFTSAEQPADRRRSEGST